MDCLIKKERALPLLIAQNKISQIEIGARGGDVVHGTVLGQVEQGGLAICNLSLESRQEIGNSNFIIAQHAVRI